MRAEAEQMEAPAPKRSLYARIKDWGANILDAAPRSLVFAGVAMAGSAALHHTMGFDPLKVMGKDGMELLKQLGLSTALGATVGGTLHSILPKPHGHGAQASATPAMGRQVASNQRGLGIEMLPEGPGNTPLAARPQARANGMG